MSLIFVIVCCLLAPDRHGVTSQQNVSLLHHQIGSLENISSSNKAFSLMFILLSLQSALIVTIIPTAHQQLTLALVSGDS